jgi:flagella basal body P-ring formation protein FlgA
MYLPGSTLSSVRVAVVKPGQGATLVWEQGGIRAEFPVICLDRGGIGESVRARVKNGDRILRAEVVSEGRLRATP